MTATILHFTPRAELSAQENLDAFVEACRASPVLNAAAQFDLNVWDLGFRKGKNHVQRAVFSTLEVAKVQRNEPALPEPFLSFAKAAIVYMHDKAPVESQGPRLAAMRCLERALRESSKDRRPTAVDAEVLDTALAVSDRSFSKGVHYRVAGQLEAIADLMRGKGFISLRVRWVHGVRKPRERDSRISKESLAARVEKLPSAAAIRGLGGLFQVTTGAADTIVSSLAALMICAPERVNEVVRLPLNCWVPGEGQFAGKYGMRWRGSKGADNTVKWLPTAMAPIAEEAIQRLKTVSQHARRVAAWYTDNPNSLYFHPDAEHLRGKELLSYEELAFLLWGTEGRRGSALTWCRQAGIEQAAQGERRQGLVRFGDVERQVLAMLPATFPHLPGDTGVLCKDALGVMFKNQLHSDRATWLCMFDSIEQNDISLRLGTREQQSLFAKYGFTEDDGSPIVLTTHMFRHYLNMLAQAGGMTSAQIAIFSGRKDERQNRAYDHMTSDEVQAPISDAIQEHGFMGALVSTGRRTLMNRSEFKGIGIVAGHTTEYGYCTHNFASEPCQMHRDCINCDEEECVKGEEHKEANLRSLKDETEYLLAQAKAALTDEEYGADLWVKHQSKTLERVTALLNLIDDPKVPVGARIRLTVDAVPLVTNAITPYVDSGGLPNQQKLKALR